MNTTRFARTLGSRQSDPEYANAISGPKPRHNAPFWWLLAIALMAVVFSIPYWSR